MKKSTPTQLRQGDVLLIARSQPGTATPVMGPDGRPLAGLRVPGERTGHAHVLPATVVESPTPAGGPARLLYLDQLGTMTHEEHAPVEVPAGWWEVRLQRQYTPRGNVSRARFD